MDKKKLELLINSAIFEVMDDSGYEFKPDNVDLNVLNEAIHDIATVLYSCRVKKKCDIDDEIESAKEDMSMQDYFDGLDERIKH
jgi:hypothetical protein